jgi:hypothetical protein
MLQLPSTLHWLSVLDEAAEQLDGGLRSFPIASYNRFSSTYGYDPPNEDYQKLFFRQATVSSSQRDSLFCPRSAGWLIPNDGSVCKPIFVAHSVLSAIWLLRETLGSDALPGEGWDKLVCAARDLADDASAASYEEPPSAQRPRDSPQPSTKRPTTSAPSSSLKRRRPSTAPPSPTSLQLSDIEQAEGSASEEPAQVTITNNNRRADRAITKKVDAMKQQKKIGLGLMKPAETAPRREQLAYASIAQKDEPIVAWIIKQDIDSEPFIYSVPSPYATACTLLEKAQLVGNPTSQASAAAFFQSWRKHGTPFAAPEPLAIRTLTSTRPRFSSSQSCVSAMHQNVLSAAWEFCDRYEQEIDVFHIKYRWAMAFLGQAYAAKVDEIKKADAAVSNDTTHNRYGKGKISSEAINALLQQLSLSETPDDRQRFRKRLGRATRWYQAAKALGWSILCLIPYDKVSTNWVESDLRLGPWHVWLELVPKVNPNACSASRALDAWLGSEGIAGGSISEKERLRIEESKPEPLTQIEEVEDSEATSDSEDEREPARRYAVSTSPAPIRPLRQLTLLELCRPLQN